MSKTRSRHRNVLVVSLVIVAGMFGFGFVLIPIYRLMANVYGFGGQMQSDDVDRSQAKQALEKIGHTGVDKNRTLTLQFIVTDNNTLQLEFRPLEKQIDLHPGQVKEVSYYVKNLGDRKLVLKALPAVSPDAAAKYVVKYECPCFYRQVLQPGESKEMTMQVAIDRNLPKYIQVLTLSYRLIEKKSPVSSDKPVVMPMMRKQTESAALTTVLL